MNDQNKRRRAIIVGIDKYASSELNELKGAENDAYELFKILSDSEKGNFEIKEGITYLHGKQATCTNIRRAISKVFIKSENELALFYFSGHGLTSKDLDDGFIAPFDIDPHHPFSGIRISEIRDIINDSISKDESKSPHALAILDCCYSGEIIQGKKGLLDAEAGIKFDDQLKSIESTKGLFVLASSRAAEESREIASCHKSNEEPTGHYHGLMTFHLLNILNGQTKPVIHRDGKICLLDVANHVSSEVKNIKNQNVLINFAGGIEITELPLVSLPIWVNEYIKKILEEVEKYKPKDLKDLKNLIKATENLKKALGRSSKNRKALSLRKKIDKAWQKFDYQPIKDWFNRNYSDIEDPLAPYAFPALETLTSINFVLSYEKIANLNKPQKMLLRRLYEASLGRPLRDFIDRCQGLNTREVQFGIQTPAKTTVVTPTQVVSKDSFS